MEDRRVLIFVLDRGFVVVGRAEVSGDIIHHWHMDQSRTIRRWGTTDGLSQLKDGPLPDTMLDPVVERLTPFRSVIDILVPTEKGVAAWEAALNKPSSSPQPKTTARR
jgi:hypothetical protein